MGEGEGGGGGGWTSTTIEEVTQDRKDMAMPDRLADVREQMDQGCEKVREMLCYRDAPAPDFFQGEQTF